MNTFRILLPLIAIFGQELQFDVRKAFSPGEFEEEIYMQIPPRYEKNAWLLI